jgi:hypothetical protein
VSWIVDLSNAVGPSFWPLVALVLVGVTIALVCETLARCSSGLDPEHDPDLAESLPMWVGSGPAAAHGDSTEGCGAVGKSAPPVEDAPPVAPARTGAAS